MHWNYKTKCQFCGINQYLSLFFKTCHRKFKILWNSLFFVIFFVNFSMPLEVSSPMKFSRTQITYEGIFVRMCLKKDIIFSLDKAKHYIFMFYLEMLSHTSTRFECFCAFFTTNPSLIQMYCLVLVKTTFVSEFFWTITTREFDSFRMWEQMFV